MIKVPSPTPDWSKIGSSSTKNGEAAQKLAMLLLRQRRFACVERVETGWRVKRVGGRIVGATPLGSVSGDFRAVASCGQSVLAECKLRSKRLVWSDFAAHQHDSLRCHHVAGGLSLVVWVNPAAVGKTAIIVKYQDLIDHLSFAPKKGITWDAAVYLDYIL